MEVATGTIVGAVFGTLLGLCAVFICVRVCRRRRTRRFEFGLDPKERRFKRVLAQQSNASIGTIFEDAGDEDDDLELNAREIEQLQQLEIELARRSGRTAAGKSADEVAVQVESAGKAAEPSGATSVVPGSAAASSSSPAEGRRGGGGGGHTAARRLDQALEAVAADADGEGTGGDGGSGSGSAGAAARPAPAERRPGRTAAGRFRDESDDEHDE